MYVHNLILLEYLLPVVEEQYWEEITVPFLDTLLPKGEEILGSTSPLKLDPLRHLVQRWFSPQALTFRVPLGSWIAPKFV